MRSAGTSRLPGGFGTPSVACRRRNSRGNRFASAAPAAITGRTTNGRQCGPPGAIAAAGGPPAAAGSGLRAPSPGVGKGELHRFDRGRRRVADGAFQVGAVRAAAAQAGLGAAQQGVHRGVQDVKGGGGKGQRQAFDDGRLSGTTGRSSRPWHRRNARRPSTPNWSRSCPSCRAAARPRVCRPKHLRPSRTSAGTGSRSTEYGVRKPATSAGTTVTPALLLAATQAGNLPPATPRRGSRFFEIAPSSA